MGALLRFPRELLAAIVFFSVADLVFTVIGLSSGVAAEQNPFARWLWGNFGILGLAAGKAAMIGVLIAFLVVAADLADMLVVRLVARALVVGTLVVSFAVAVIGYCVVLMPA